MIRREGGPRGVLKLYSFHTLRRVRWSPSGTVSRAFAASASRRWLGGRIQTLGTKIIRCKNQKSGGIKNEGSRTRQHCSNCQHLITALELRTDDEHFGQLEILIIMPWSTFITRKETHLRVQRKLSHDSSKGCELAIIIQRRQKIQQFQRPHQRLRRRGIHVIEPYEILKQN